MAHGRLVWSDWFIHFELTIALHCFDVFCELVCIPYAAVLSQDISLLAYLYFVYDAGVE